MLNLPRTDWSKLPPWQSDKNSGLGGNCWGPQQFNNSNRQTNVCFSKVATWLVPASGGQTYGIAATRMLFTLLEIFLFLFESFSCLNLILKCKIHFLKLDILKRIFYMFSVSISSHCAPMRTLFKYSCSHL